MGDGGRARATRTNLLALTAVGALALWYQVADLSTVFAVGGVAALVRLGWLILCLSPVVGAAYVALRFFTDKVVMGAGGIARRFAGRETRLTWDEVTDVRTGDGVIALYGRGRPPLYLRPSDYAFGSELTNRIEEYRRLHQSRASLLDSQADVPDSVTAITAPAATAPEVQFVGRAGDR